MDACERDRGSHKHSTKETLRSPGGVAERNNETTRRSRTREVPSRYRSPSPSAGSGLRRCPSPSTTKPAVVSSKSAPRRAISAERRRPATPPSPPSPSTPADDTAAVIQLASKKLMNHRLPEALWPSTMRSLSVSFQSDSFSLPVSKREKPASHALSDRTLRPSSNVAHKQSMTAPVSRKSTPERKRSPLKGRNSNDQSENSRPVDSLHGRPGDHHRWPSTTSGKVSSTASTKRTDIGDRTTKSLITPVLAVSSLRRVSLPISFSRPLQNSPGDAMRLISSDGSAKIELEASSAEDNAPKVPSVVSVRSSERTKLVTPPGLSQSLPTSASRPASPNRTNVSSTSFIRGLSPSRTRTFTPNSSRGVSPAPSRGVSPVPSRGVTPSRGVSPVPSKGVTPSPSRGVSPSPSRGVSPSPSRGSSPSRTRPSSPSRQSSSSTSVLSYIADLKKGKKVASQIEDVHQLRVLYNKQLQWQYVNAQADAALNSQKVTSEKALCNVWRTTSELWDSVAEKRIELQDLRLKLNLYSVLKEQVAYLDQWPIIEKDHSCALSGAIKDLQASTLRLPVTEGARANNDIVKAALCSAIEVMQTTGNSICSVLSRVEGRNTLVSELADVAAQERAMLDECEALLATTTAMQVEENSLRTHLVQLKQHRFGDEHLIYDDY